jgi:hypothetical protein
VATLAMPWSIPLPLLQKCVFSAKRVSIAVKCTSRRHWPTPSVTSKQVQATCQVWLAVIQLFQDIRLSYQLRWITNGQIGAIMLLPTFHFSKAATTTGVCIREVYQTGGNAMIQQATFTLIRFIKSMSVERLCNEVFLNGHSNLRRLMD